MNRNHRLLPCPVARVARVAPVALIALAALVSSAALPGAAQAQESYTYSVGLLGGLGGSPDPDRGDGFEHTGLQLNLDLVTEPYTHLGLRVGQLALDSSDFFGPLSGADLTYVTLGGEYRYAEGWYDSGVYLGLGGYRLQGDRADGSQESDTAVGAVLGFTGEFQINRWMGVLIELSGHYADLEEAQVFGMAHAGLTFHF